MAAHAYSLRTRLNGQSPSARTTPSGSPLAKSGIRSPRKAPPSNASLQLTKVIGTTTSTPTGLACCPAANSYVYCAGAVTVHATVQDDGTTVERYFKARPTASSLNPVSSYYDGNSPASSPHKRRNSIFSIRQTQDAEPSRDWADDGGSQTWSARERIKSVTCVSLSTNGRWLAVGESGFSPRVLLYSTAEESLRDVPVSIIADHSFGVRSVSFSPDGRYLATLGNLNDGFLFVWSMNTRTGQLTLHSTNKCTTNVSDMVWCGSSLVTAGTRHVKVWQLGSTSKPSPTKRFKLRSGSEEVAISGPSTLHGRNALLGSMNDCTFTSVVAISQETVVLGTDAGHICALQVSAGSPELALVATLDYGITSIALQASSRRLVVGSRRGISFEDLLDIAGKAQSSRQTSSDSLRPWKKTRRSSAIRQSLGIEHPDSIGISAVGSLSKHVVALDTNGNLHVQGETDQEQSMAERAFACHSDAIQGVDKLSWASQYGSFFTWSRRGDVRFWKTDGKLVDHRHVVLEQQELDAEDDQNELKVLRYCPKSDHFIAGDRFGILKLIRSGDWHCVWTGRAHGAEVTDIAVHTDSQLVATSSRDRMVQLFTIRDQQLDLLQTMDDHIGAINHVSFSGDGTKLISCSADRTVVVRDRAQRHVDDVEAIAFLSTRVVTLKSNPLSMAFTDGACATLLISTMDRHVVKIDIINGAILDTLKVTDPENDDTVTLNAIHTSSRGTTSNELCDLLVAYSSTDKSIRLFDAAKCQLLARDCGHTEGISDVCLIDDRIGTDIRRTIVSTGLDGTIMLWNISLAAPVLSTPFQEQSQAQSMSGYDSDATPVKASPASLPPLRKVLSRVETLEFSKSSGLVSPSSPSSLRSLSPMRLTRKRSNLTLSATIDESEEHHPSPLAGPSAPALEVRGRQEEARSPSPPPSGLTKLKKQRSRSVVGGNDTSKRSTKARRSPSPPSQFSASTPTTSHHRTQANNSRLRRPPSMPNDLRAQSLAQGRRPSMPATSSDFGSIAVATEAACRMLRTYKKKLTVSKENVSLDELEDELEGMLRAVKEKRETSQISKNSIVRRKMAKAATEGDVEELTAFMERTDMGNRRTVDSVGVSVQG